MVKAKTLKHKCKTPKKRFWMKLEASDTPQPCGLVKESLLGNSWDELTSDERELIVMRLEMIISLMSKNERVVLSHRYCLCGAEFLYRREIAQLIARSAERVRQIEYCAIRKLQHPYNMQVIYAGIVDGPLLLHVKQG